MLFIFNILFHNMFLFNEKLKRKLHSVSSFVFCETDALFLEPLPTMGSAGIKQKEFYTRGKI